MGHLHEEITAVTANWIREQRIFFVATAPLAREGHVNCSPKGGDTFRIIDPVTVAYQDLTGSGVETVAHLQENGRVVIMFCAFSGPPKILRLHGIGKVVTETDPKFPALAALFPPNTGMRGVIHVTVTRISDSCGYAVPFLDYQKDRNSLDEWANSKGMSGLKKYQQEKNRQSLDGLSGLL